MLFAQAIIHSLLSFMIFVISLAFMFLMKHLMSGHGTGHTTTLKTLVASQNSVITFILLSGMKRTYVLCYDETAIIRV